MEKYDVMDKPVMEQQTTALNSQNILFKGLI